MIKSTTLVTYEAENADEAAEEILEQLGERVTLLKNTCGIIACNIEFIQSGVVSKIQEVLPFPVVGEQTMTQAYGFTSEDGSESDREVDVLMLTILVLTSDDAEFTVGHTSHITSETNLSVISDLISEKLGGKEPKLILAFVPFLFGRTGDSYSDELSRRFPGVPIFGSVAAGLELSYDGLQVIGSDETADDIFAYVVFSGEVSPKFAMESVKFENRFSRAGSVTKSRENIIIQINNIPAFTYISECGLFEEGQLAMDVLGSFPFTLKFDNGDEVCRAFAAALPDGCIAAAGNVPEGSTMQIFSVDRNAILETAKSLVSKINDIDGGTLLMYSCVGRRATLSGDPTREAADVIKAVRSDLNFIFAYSGGEFCPTGVRDGKAANRFHNYTIVACVI